MADPEITKRLIEITADPEHGSFQVAADGAMMRLNVYGPGVVRVQWLPDGMLHRHMRRTWSLVDSAGVCPVEGWDRASFHPTSGHPCRYEAATRYIDTGALHIGFAEDGLALGWADGIGELLSDNPYIAYQRQGEVITHTASRMSGYDHFYGFGEMSGGLDKHGRFMRLRNTDAFGYDAEHSHPLYKHVPFYITLHGDRAYGLFYDTPYACSFDMGANIDNYYGDFRQFQATGGHLDYYFLYGPSIETVMEHYTRLTGRIPLPPKWTLAYMGSAMRYTDAPNATEMLAEFVELCKKHRIPCGGFHLSSGYSMAEDGKRYVFMWNRARVPDPAAMTDTFHRAGMHVIANVKPGVLFSHPRFEEIAPLCIQAPNTQTPDTSLWWGGEGAHLDFTNPATFAWWQHNVTEQLLRFGVDCTWNDNNEFNISNDAARCFGFGEEAPIAALRPVQTTLMAMSSHAAQTAFAPDRRPWLLTRAGGPGTQRYAATWTGDNRVGWKTLQYNIAMGLGLGLSGYANMGHDVGGFAGEPPDSELFLRWLENGILHPRFVIHSWRTDARENAPWMYPNHLPEVRALFRFRARLLPYLYALLHEASETGHPVLRPLVYHHAHDAKTHEQSFDFLLGSDLLAANVYISGLRQRDVYLPRGSAWYDWHTGKYHPGGEVVTIPAPLGRPPLLGRAGGMVPVQASADQYRVYAFPEKGNAESFSHIYEDDGLSLAYQRGDYRQIRLRMVTTRESIRLISDVPVLWSVPKTEHRPVSQHIMQSGWPAG
jgi:alpha-glucosidase